MFSFHDHHTDLHFSWDGWMQIKITPGPSAPPAAVPDRVDIREPDLRDPARHSLHPADGSVHLVPQTQEAFEALCLRWARGDDLCAGLRDYTTDPWSARSWGITCGAFRYHYRGGTHIEAAPADHDTWRPLIDLHAEGRTRESLSTVWLMQRTDGWERAWLSAHGIDLLTHDDPATATFRWTQANLPRSKSSVAAAFSEWLYRQAAAELGDQEWRHHRNLGTPYRPITSWQPWAATRLGADRARWNFRWDGGPYAYVWSPDHPLTGDEVDFAHRDTIPGPDRDTQTRWLDQHADAWTAARH